MEKFSFVKNGVLRLPPGFRFHPTDQELVVQYLKRKVYDCPLPASIIPEFDVCKSDPWDLPGDSEQERYFFSTKEAKYPNGNRANRATASGYWKATGIDKQILTPSSSRGHQNQNQTQNQIVGMKKTLVFYRGKPPHGSKTDWIMHEYRLVDNDDPPQNMNLNQSPGGVVPRGNWVLCRIFLKRRSSAGARNDGPMIETSDTRNNNRNDNADDNNNNRVCKVRNDRPILYDFMGSCSNDKNRGHCNNTRTATLTVVVPSASSSSSGSSGVTEVSFSSSSSDHDASSSCNSFPYFTRKSV